MTIIKLMQRLHQTMAERFNERVTVRLDVLSQNHVEIVIFLHDRDIVQPFTMTPDDWSDTEAIYNFIADAMKQHEAQS
jgi:hypothetical protein